MDSRTTALEVIYLPLTSLKPQPQNPRVHSDKQVGQIAQSIEAFGFNVPILVDDKQNVVAGHGRLLAARKLGWNTVPVIKLNHLNESQYSAFMIADNRLTENSSWDERLLGEQLKVLSSTGLRETPVARIHAEEDPERTPAVTRRLRGLSNLPGCKREPILVKSR
jgi:ParB-like chromosome segregation protein Spo0J